MYQFIFRFADKWRCHLVYIFWPILDKSWSKLENPGTLCQHVGLATPGYAINCEATMNKADSIRVYSCLIKRQLNTNPPTEQWRGILPMMERLLLTSFGVFVVATSGIAAAMNNSVSSMEIPLESGVERMEPLPDMASIQGTFLSSKESSRGVVKRGCCIWFCQPLCGHDGGPPPPPLWYIWICCW